MLIMYFKSNIFDNVDPGFFSFLTGRDRTKNPKLDSVVISTRGKQLYQTFPHAEAKILIGGLGLGPRKGK